MQLEGIHHISSVTADAAANVKFYAGLLGLRMVKKTVNQDEPSVYHLFYADDGGSPGADMTFFEYPGARRGRAGAGMIHRIAFRVADPDALSFWQRRLDAAGVSAQRDGSSLRFADPEGIGLELVVEDVPDAPLVATHPDVPAAHAIQGFAGVRIFADHPQLSAALLAEVLSFTPASGDGSSWEVRGSRRGARYVYDPAPAERGMGGAGTVHHVAFSVEDDEYDAWVERIDGAGVPSSGPVDRFYFRSIYFREPNGVLFELATMGPGFDADEPRETMGERLSLPPHLEPYRQQIEAVLTPLPVVPRGDRS